MMLQLLLGGIAGAWVVVKLYGRRILTFFGKKPKVDPAEIGDRGPAGAAPEDPYVSEPEADDPYASYRTEDTRRDDPYAAFREATPRRSGPYDR